MAADFFDRQEQARRQTNVLICLFAMAVMFVLILNYMVLASFIQPFLKPLPHARRQLPLVYSVFWLIGEVVTSPIGYLKWLWNFRLACWIALGTFISIGLGCAYKIRFLSAGGSAVAELLGGKRIDANTADTDEQRLRNVIEEMAIASGTPIPDVYLLENERGINAFAAGHTRQDVAIAVTRGCLKLLTREELQGVIAHEFSHILNGDTQLNMRLMALAHGLFWPTLLGRLLIRGNCEPPRDDESIFDDEAYQRYLPTAPIGVILLILGTTSLPFVRLLKSAVCRQREWLADASAVQFTRNPEGITGAFKKIGGLSRHGRLDAPNAEVASHLYFVNSANDSWLPIFAIHPSLLKRILAIEPAFDGAFPKVKPLAPNQYERDRKFEETAGNILAAARMSPETLVAATGKLAANQIQQAAVIRLGLPLEIKQKLQGPAGAACVIYCLLLSGEGDVRARQKELLRGRLDSTALSEVEDMAAHVDALAAHSRLPLAEFAVSALRRLDADEAAKFCNIMQELIECDGAIELFEYTLMKMVQRRLLPATTHVEGRKQVREVLPECALLLSALAHVGHDTEAEAQNAFAEGSRFLDAPGVQINFVPRSDWDLNKVDAASASLADCSPSARRNILMACGRTVIADGRVAVREVELLRVIADSLDCPMPPFVEAARSEELAHGA